MPVKLKNKYSDKKQSVGKHKRVFLRSFFCVQHTSHKCWGVADGLAYNPLMLLILIFLKEFKFHFVNSTSTIEKASKRKHRPFRAVFKRQSASYSTVTDFARFLGLSISQPF